MPHTVYATFHTAHDAERAAGALMDHGIPADAISFIIPGDMHPHSAHARVPNDLNAPATVPTNSGEAMLADVPAPDPLNSGHVHAPGLMGHRIGGAEDISSGLGRTAYTSRDTMIQEDLLDQRSATVAGDEPGLSIDLDAAEHVSRAAVENKHHQEPHAATGLSTTTLRDAERGAAAGVGIGAGLGLLLGLACVAIPGVGFVAGTGALIAMLAGATAVAGGIAGGALGYLEDLGMSSDSARRMAANLEQGQPIVAIHSTFDGHNVDIPTILAKYGATFMETL